MNFHICKLFAFAFVLVVLVFKPISAKPQMPQVPQMPQIPQMPGMPDPSQTAAAGMDTAKGFGKMAMDNIPSPGSMSTK